MGFVSFQISGFKEAVYTKE